MKAITICLCSLLLFSAQLALGQAEIPPHYSQHDFLLASPGALGVGLYGFDNPAILTYLHQPDLYFAVSDMGGKLAEFNRWGLFLGAPHIGFGAVHQKAPTSSGVIGVTDYRLSVALGDITSSYGVGFGWSGGDKDLLNRKSLITLGWLFRPMKYLSFGATGAAAMSGSGKEAVIDIAARPMGNELVTVFTDCAIQQNESLKDLAWSAGAAIEPLPGIRLIGRYFDTQAFSMGISVSVGRAGVISQSHFDKEGKRSSTMYGLRIGALDRNIVRSYFRDRKSYVEMNFLGPVKYQRFRFFDKSLTLIDILADIKAAQEDPTVAGIAINTSGMDMNKEMLWEVREQLRQFKSAGKRVVVHIDRGGIGEYYFASVADKILMDPQGGLALQGLIAGRTFFKGTLEKLGVGFDEWRLFKYKSALESFSRDSMSAGDREQRQKLIDDGYQLLRTEICAARNFTPERFDNLVNNVLFFTAKDALENGLVDTLGRWESVKEIVKKIEGEDKRMIGAGSVAERVLPIDDRWGERPKIAVIYALGVCAMDEGITARKLVKDVEAATNDPCIKAVVLRVDSPGGDPLPSDVIAEAVKKCREKKPVIVSQGAVAASGGYWLSMYGDMIVAAPITITGSIGVIGGWIYNKGLKETLGVSTDYVKIGDHADLGFGMSLPLLGLTLPDRNLTAAERSIMESKIKALYNEFVSKVASGRKKNTEEIETIAQGRVWFGSDGLRNGLVDVLGGLETAIALAKDRAGIPKEEKVTIVELPKKGLIDLGMFEPKLLPIMDEHTVLMIEDLKFRMKRNGQPLPMLPMGDYEMR